MIQFIKVLTLAALFLGSSLAAQVSAPMRITVQDEGATQGRVRIVNFTGASVTASVAGDVATVNVTGGGAASVTTTTLTLNSSTMQRFTVTDAAVTTSSKIVGSIRRPDVTETDDAGWVWLVNIVRVQTGSFDVLIWLPEDSFGNAPSGSIEFQYIVG